MRIETRAKLRLHGIINARQRAGKFLSLTGLWRLALKPEDEVSAAVDRVMRVCHDNPDNPCSLRSWKRVLMEKGCHYTQNPRRRRGWRRE